jgi:hypothetical protein
MNTGVDTSVKDLLTDSHGLFPPPG